MTDIALFHSVLGVRPGVEDAAERLPAAGHDVLVVDQYQGRVFDDHEEAGRVRRSDRLPRADAAGRLGCGGRGSYTLGDPFRRQESIDAVVTQVQASGSRVQVFDYPGTGHLFTDPSLPAEYDATAADLLWTRVLTFCEAPRR